MAEARIRSSRVVTFADANPHDERMAAVLVNRDDTGALKAYVATTPGRPEPDPEIVAALVQSVEIRNL